MTSSHQSLFYQGHSPTTGASLSPRHPRSPERYKAELEADDTPKPGPGSKDWMELVTFWFAKRSSNDRLYQIIYS
jgi:hypothetical protein